MLGLALLLLTGLAALFAAVTAYTAWMLLHPPRRNDAWALARSLPSTPGELTPPAHFTAWNFRSRGRDLPVWDIQGGDPAGPVLVLTHGWGESRTVSLARIDALRSLASRIIAWDLPGHGRAPGVCALGAVEAADLHALLERLAESPPIVLFGASLGAGISIAAAADPACPRPIAAVIAEAPYRLPITPARAVLRQIGLPHRGTLRAALALAGTVVSRNPGLAWESTGGTFDRARHAALLRCPLLVIHGDLDSVCPIEDGRSIAAAAPRGTLQAVPGGHHLDLWTFELIRLECLRALGKSFARTGPCAKD